MVCLVIMDILIKNARSFVLNIIMATLIPILSTTPGSQLSYNPSMAETFSWVPIAASGRPLFAQAVYPINMQEQLTTITNVLCAILAKP